MTERTGDSHARRGEEFRARSNWLHSVPSVYDSRRRPKTLVDVASALKAPRNWSPPPPFTFHAVPGTDPDTLQAGELLVELATHLLPTLKIVQIEQILREVELLAGGEETIDAEAYEALTSEPAPSHEEQIALRVRTLLRSFDNRRKLLEDSLTEEHVQRLLGVTADFALDWSRPPRRLLAVLDFGDYRFPRWQFDPAASDGVLSGLSLVLAELDQVPQIQQLAWFAAEQPELNGMTPVDALRAGAVDAVRSAAQALRHSTAGAA